MGRLSGVFGGVESATPAGEIRASIGVSGKQKGPRTRSEPFVMVDQERFEHSVLIECQKHFLCTY